MTAEAAEGRQGVRLQKYLSRAGVASRRAGERLIREGRVSIDGTVVTELGTRVVPGEQVVRVDGDVIKPGVIRWIALHKPAGYLTSRSDDRGRPTVYALLPERLEELFYVGRLDRMTEGLLIFTNEGDAAHRLLHPSHQIPRRYRARVKGEVGVEVVRRLERGIALEDGVACAENVRVRRDPRSRGSGRATYSEIELTLREGRKREVRRMLEELGFVASSLVRISYGPVELGSLAPGKWRELTAKEISALRSAVGLRDDNGDT